jgi:putative ABC transport system permease protein
VISPDYFRAVDVPLLAGRPFSAADRVGAEGVVIVNRTLARRIWPGESPLGKRITFDRADDPKATWRTVVGEVGDVRARDLRRESESQAYWPMLRDGTSEASLVVRTRQRPSTLVAPIRQIVQSIDRDLPLDRVRTLEEVVATSLSQNRVNTVLLGVFGSLALLLAAVGIYGLVSYTVQQRTHEIGIRVALGAGRRQVLGLIIGQGMGLVLVGLLVGLVVSYLAGKLVADQLFGVGVADPLTYGAVCGVLGAVALLANWLPARRATRVDPLEALRSE